MDPQRRHGVELPQGVERYVDRYWKIQRGEAIQDFDS